MIIDSIKAFFTKGDSRSILIKKNVLASIVLKGISIVVSFMLIPMTINYVNPTQYGVWVTLSSLMTWFMFFDIGLGLGFKNRFAESKARGETELSRCYVSTTYAAIGAISLILLVAALSVNHFIDWSSILNLPGSYREELSKTFGILIICFSFNLVGQILNMLLAADQRPALSSVIQVAGQICSLIGIWVLTITTHHGSIVSLAYLSGIIPVGVLLLSTVVFFSTRYKIYRPSVSHIRPRLVKDLLSMGLQFFVITTSMLFIFQLMNVIISREMGPDSVTQYNLSYKYFNIMNLVAAMVLNPFWAAFTDAYVKGDGSWMRTKLRQLERMGMLLIPAAVLMLLIAPLFMKLWVGDKVEIPFAVNLSVSVYTVTLTFGNIYMYIINGIGTVRIQLYIYLGFAVIAFPVMSYACRLYGIPGLLIIPALVYTLQAIAGAVQIRRLISGTARGIWKK